MGFTLAFMLSVSTNWVVAYKTRGAAERALYYMAYLAEEEYVLSTGETRTYEIAPGCYGTTRTKKPGRCTLEEFLLYIWAPQEEDDDKISPEERPTEFSKFGAILDNDASLGGITPLISKIDNARTEFGLVITGNCDPSRLWPSYTGADYFDILGRMGEPINKLISSLPSNPTAIQTRIVRMAKDAASAVVGLRWEDMERYRLGFFRKNLGFDVETRPFDIGYQGRKTQIMDVWQTAIKHPGSTPDIINWANYYLTMSETQANHFKAITSAQKVALSFGCAIPVHATPP